MIKLNNKKITYVALADTNNSIKAPKEIWYADSSNSVKLVYRRKDALIEGEDYEKYHWLVGDNVAYIQGVRYNLWNNHLQMNIGKIQDADLKSDLKYFYYSQNNNYFIVDTQRYEEIKYRLRIRYRENAGNGHVGDIIPYSSMPISLIIDFYIEDGRGYVERNGETFVGNTTFSQDIWTSINPRIYSFKMSYIREVLPNDTYISNLIPCKLLKPVPKWLDANGIRRQVGECGMIDLVSGKFYGNVNSTGTFTVENYYERKEWLIADIPDNKRCIDLPINSNEMSYSMLIQKAGNNTFFETIGNYRYYTTYGTIPSIRVWNIATSSDVGTFNVGLQTNKLFNITSNESSLTINGIEVQKFGFPISAVVLRSGATLGNAITETSSIFVNGVERYIPCTLTMDLPASMDANNIARTKGTSGMWDLVSDKFYGNVANSGTFKAVNLAEGVDYEVHQWLVTEIPNGTFLELPLNTSNFSFKRIFCDMYNVNYFWSKNTLYAYHHAHYHNRIWDIKNATGYWISSTSTSINSEVTISSTSEVLEINGEEVPQVDYPPSIIKFRNANSPAATSVFKTSSITVDGIERYIPVKLLKSIPAKYDANGIVRQAGECGMYDTVNDVFYGNVASSGTFSVEDDS